MTPFKSLRRCVWSWCTRLCPHAAHTGEVTGGEVDPVLCSKLTKAVILVFSCIALWDIIFFSILLGQFPLFDALIQISCFDSKVDVWLLYCVACACARRHSWMVTTVLDLQALLALPQTPKRGEEKHTAKWWMAHTQASLLSSSKEVMFLRSYPGKTISMQQTAQVSSSSLQWNMDWGHRWSLSGELNINMISPALRCLGKSQCLYRGEQPHTSITPPLQLEGWELASGQSHSQIGLGTTQSHWPFICSCPMVIFAIALWIKDLNAEWGRKQGRGNAFVHCWVRLTWKWDARFQRFAHE